MRQPDFIIKLYKLIRRKTCPFGLIEQYIPRNGDIYDLGCGYGQFINFLSRFSYRNCEYTGFDIDNKRIEFALKNNFHPSVQFKKYDITGGLNIKEAGCITLIDALVFLPFYKQEEILSRCFGYLKKGGVLIIKDITNRPRFKYFWHQMQEFFVLYVFKLVRGEGIYCRSAESYKAMLEKIGFKVKVVPADKGYLYPHILYICHK